MSIIEYNEWSVSSLNHRRVKAIDMKSENWSPFLRLLLNVTDKHKQFFYTYRQGKQSPNIIEIFCKGWSLFPVVLLSWKSSYQPPDVLTSRIQIDGPAYAPGRCVRSSYSVALAFPALSSGSQFLPYRNCRSLSETIKRKKLKPNIFLHWLLT